MQQDTDGARRLASWAAIARPAAFIAIAWTLAQIAFVIWPQIPTIAQRGLHVSFAISLSFAMLGEASGGKAATWLWRCVAIVALVPGLYVAYNGTYLTSIRIQGLDPVSSVQYVLGTLLIVLIFEAGRRALGHGLVIFAGIFVLYFFAGPYLPSAFAHRYTGFERFMDMEYLSLDGILGVPTGVSVSTVFYFILFAAVYDVFGGGRLIIDLALSLTGRRVGGPAKAAVVASGMLGSVSGSAVANVMSTGIFTIPLMRKAGYDPRFAGGVEAAASTGAQLVPPVMGAAAFIMADFLQISYQTIVLAAILPAIAYYLALVAMVHLEARSRSIPVIEDTGQQLPLGKLMRERGHLLLPLVWLAFRILNGFPAEVAAMEASLGTLLVGTLRKVSRRSGLSIVEGLVVAAERSVTVALPCALAGIVVAIISFTGLGTKFTSFIVAAAGGQVGILLVLTMAASLVLGAGMPTTSAYIMAAILLAPGLISLGVEPLVAHFFIFYFAILSMVTPPVALAAYAAAAITGSSASATGWRAFALSLPGFVIPYAAVFHPGLLFAGSPGDAAWAMLNVVCGLMALAAGIIGWLFRPLSRLERLGFGLAGIIMTLPGLVVTAGGCLAFAGLTGWSYTRNRTAHTGPKA